MAATTVGIIPKIVNPVPVKRFTQGLGWNRPLADWYDARFPPEARDGPIRPTGSRPRVPVSAPLSAGRQGEHGQPRTAGRGTKLGHRRTEGRGTNTDPFLLSRSLSK